MAAEMSDAEGWENLTQEEMSSTDPGVVARIQKLLRVAYGHPGDDRETPEQRKALNLLRRLTSPVILNRCSMRLNLERTHPDVIALSDRIFGSHATGEQFIRDARYKSWLEIWQPEKGPFRLLVALTATSRSKDWLASIGRNPDLRHRASPEGPEADGGSMGVEPSQPDLDFEFREVESQLDAAIDRLRPGKAQDAIRARVCRGMTAKEYAAEVGINQSAAHMQMNRGAEALRERLVKDGLVGEGFGCNIISVTDLTRRVLSRLAPGVKLDDFWEEGANGRA